MFLCPFCPQTGITHKARFYLKLSSAALSSRLSFLDFSSSFIRFPPPLGRWVRWLGVACDLIPVPRTPSQSQTPQSTALHCSIFLLLHSALLKCAAGWSEERGGGAHSRLAFLQKLGDETWRVPAWGEAPVWREWWGWNGNIWLWQLCQTQMLQ